MKTTVVVLAASLAFVYVATSALVSVFRPLLAALGGA